MSIRFNIVYLAHSLRSDWNNGNAHFLRGLLRAMTALGHKITILEPETSWSHENLQTEPLAEHSLATFTSLYPTLSIKLYPEREPLSHPSLTEADLVILHEWNPPALAHRLLELRSRANFRLLFHDTHHRASSSPEQIALFGLTHFDGIIAFGSSLQAIYNKMLPLTRVWTLHEAADTTIFHPIPTQPRITGPVWIGNWGDDERSTEITDFFLKPAATLTIETGFTIYGVRYPLQALQALQQARVHYAGYLPNLDAPATYARAALTVHIPRQQYTTAMTGIPTIRVFEALACGIPLISAPWQDTEHLFRPDDFLWAHNTAEMTEAIRTILHNPEAAAAQAHRGRETILARHTCDHRAQELTAICVQALQ